MSKLQRLMKVFSYNFLSAGRRNWEGMTMTKSKAHPPIREPWVPVGYRLYL